MFSHHLPPFPGPNEKFKFIALECPTGRYFALLARSETDRFNCACNNHTPEGRRPRRLATNTVTCGRDPRCIGFCAASDATAVQRERDEPKRVYCFVYIFSLKKDCACALALYQVHQFAFSRGAPRTPQRMQRLLVFRAR